MKTVRCVACVLLLLMLLISNGGLAMSLETSSRLLSVKYFNNGVSMYALVITKNSASQLVAYVLDSGGNEAGSYNYGDASDASSIYLLPIDRFSNQQVQDVLIFVSTDSGLKSIYSSSIASSIIESGVNMMSISPIVGLMAYPPQVIYHDETSYYVVVSYQSTVVVYLYTPGISQLSYLKTLSFNGENIIKIFPFRGFIMVLTGADKAYFIALDAALGNFDTISGLVSVAESYVHYDPATQRVLLDTGAGATEIQDAPVPYGITAMSEIRS